MSALLSALARWRWPRARRQRLAVAHGARRRARFEALIDRVRAVRVRFYRDLTAQSALLEIATGMGGLAIIVTGTLLVSGGSLDAGLLPLLALLAMAAFLPVSEIAHIGRQLADTLGAARRLFAIQNERVAVVDGPGVEAPGVEAPGVDAADASADAGAPAIAFDAVSFTYEGRSEPALDQVTLNIPAGATVALVGSSGAGKTTIAAEIIRRELAKPRAHPQTPRRLVIVLAHRKELIAQAAARIQNNTGHAPQTIAGGRIEGPSGS